MFRAKADRSSPIRQAIFANRWDTVKALLEKNNYREQYDPGDVYDIITWRNVHDSVRHTACYYLLAHAPLPKLKTLAERINFSFRDSDEKDAVLVAVANGRQDVLAWLVNDLGLSIHTKCKYGSEAVLYAVANEQIAMLELLVKPKEQDGYGLSLDVTNKYGTGPVLMAAYHGRQRMLELLVKCYGLKIGVRANSGAGVVLNAISSGQTDLLEKLLRPVDQEGYGLSLDVRTHAGNGPVLQAICHGQMALLKTLLTPIIEGGYGLSLDVKNLSGCGPVLMAIHGGRQAMLATLLDDYRLSLNVTDVARGWGPVEIAIESNEPEILETLLKPVNQGGYGLRMVSRDICLQRALENEKCFVWLCLHIFNQQLLEHCLEDAIKWIRNSHTYTRAITWLSQPLIRRYKELLEYHVNFLDLSDKKISARATLLTEEIEQLSPGEGRLFIAELYARRGDYITAYQNYLSVFEDKSCPADKHHQAGFELASMIFKADVTLKDGVLVETQSDPDIQWLRALYAYEYLYKDDSETTGQLRCRLNNALAQNTSAEMRGKISWDSDIVDAYFYYYRTKKPGLLKEEGFFGAYNEMQRRNKERANDNVDNGSLGTWLSMLPQ